MGNSSKSDGDCADVMQGFRRGVWFALKVESPPLAIELPYDSQAPIA